MIVDRTPVNHNKEWIRKELQRVRLRIEDHEEIISLDIMNLKYDVIFKIV